MRIYFQFQVSTTKYMFWYRYLSYNNMTTNQVSTLDHDVKEQWLFFTDRTPLYQER